MSSAAVALVMAAALVHAAWNLGVKKAEDQAAFLFLATVAAAGLGLPLAVGALALGAVPPAGLAAAAASAGVHAAYFALLGAAYRRGDLSVVYPVARGSSPLLVAVVSGPLLGERLAPVGAAGVATIVVGLVLVAGASVWRLASGEAGAAPHRSPLPGIGLGLCVGTCSAAYSFIDRTGVTLVVPPVYLALQIFGAAALLAPIWLGSGGGRGRLAAAARPRRRAGAATLCGAGILGAYGLVLVAMTRAPIAYVVAGRELAIVFGTVLGAVVLGERVTPLGAAGALLVTAGVGLLAFA